MKRGFLVINSFFRSESFQGVQNALLAAFAAKGMTLTPVKNGDLLPVLGQEEAICADFAVFWCKDTPLARALETRGLRVFNPSEAIRLCDDKGLTHLALEEKNLPQPKTILAPHTYENIGYTDVSFLETVGEKLGFPLVVKERFGSFGQQVYLAKDMASLREIVEKIGCVKHLYQAFVPSVYDEKPSDLRLCVVGGEVVAAIRRVSDGDFRANLEIGGSAAAITPDDEAKNLALSAVSALGLDWAGVDLLWTKEEGYLICEVNSNFFFGGLAAATGIDPAAYIAEYVKKSLA